MFFDLTNDAQRRQFREYAERLLQRGSVVRLTDERPRTPEQNSFYQLLIAFFACRTGLGTDTVADLIVKRTVCPDIFLRDGIVRSSADLTRDEMRTVISRFQFWSSTEAGIELPESGDYRIVINALRRVEEDREYVKQPRMRWHPK